MSRQVGRVLCVVLFIVICSASLAGCSKKISAAGKIVFISTRDGNPEIYIMNTDGSDQTRLTFTKNVDEACPIISPDGQKILFATDYDQYGVSPLSIMNINGKKRKDLKIKGTNPVFSTSGKEIYYATDDGIYQIEIDGTGKKCLVEAEVAIRFALSKDGTRIAFLEKMDQMQNWDLFEINSNGSSQKKLVAELDTTYTDYDTGEEVKSGFLGFFDYSPEGDYIIFQCRQDATVIYKESGVYVIPTDGGDPLLISDPDRIKKFAYFTPFFSSDGETFFFAQGTYTRGEYSIASMTVDGNGEKIIADVEEEVDGEQRVALSPNGDHIVYVSKKGDSFQIFTVDTDGGKSTRLTDDGENYQPDYSPVA